MPAAVRHNLPRVEVVVPGEDAIMREIEEENILTS
jgi:hypothetical protein